VKEVETSEMRLSPGFEVSASIVPTSCIVPRPRKKEPSGHVPSIACSAFSRHITLVLLFILLGHISHIKRQPETTVGTFAGVQE
jgi:hypothetical protein